MGIYRGPGGTGDAVNDASSEALITVQAKDAALAAQAAAEAAQAAAELAETNAETAETNAETAETNAETAATNAANSASAASTSASNAASSASAASTSASNASTSATNAANSAAAASTSASNAASSASTATTQATNASNSASAAATSATNASNSASAAATSATNAANSATAAQTAQTAAELAETNAETAETNAETAETNAAASASAAATSASNASTSASNAATSATNASNSASAAATSATNASNSASAAATSATNASNSASAAATSATNAAASYDSFDDRYLGAKSSAPTLDNDGNTLLVGALYFNTTTNEMKVWSGSAWLNAYASLSGALLATNNLSDLNNTATARTNLGVAIGVNVQAWDADLDTWATKTAPSGTVVGTSDSQTLTNKTLTTPVISTISNTGTLTLPTSTDTLVGRATSDTLTNKTIALGSNTVSGTLAQFNTAVTDADLVSIAGSETLTNKTLTSPTINTATISGGTINNAAIGGTTPAAGSFTSLTDSGNLTFTGTGNRITGDFSNATIANRVAFQTSTTNANTAVTAIPNGTATSSNFTAYNNSDPTNASLAQFLVGSSDVRVISTLTGTGTFLPLTMYTGGSERLRIDTSGNVGIGTSSPGTRLAINDPGTGLGFTNAASGNFNIGLLAGTGSQWAYIFQRANSDLLFGTNNTERMRIDSNGNLLVGTTTARNRLTVSSSASAVAPTLGTASGTAMFTNNNDAYGMLVGSAGGGQSWIQVQRVDSVATAYDLWLQPSGGNVGIGTSSPAERLHVVGNSRTVGDINSFGTGGVVQSRFTSIDAIGGGYVGTTSNHLFYFVTNNTQRMLIDTNGNVGIGTSSPTSRLYVEGTVQARLGSTGIQIYGTGGSGEINSAGANPMLFNVNSTERMRITSGGDVGIGTSSFVGSERVNITFNSSGATTQALNTRDSNASANGNYHIVLRRSDDTYLGGLRRVGTDNAMGVDGNAYLSLQTTGTERMRIDSSGNVGIAVSSPLTKLHMAGGTDDANVQDYITLSRTGYTGSNFRQVIASSSGSVASQNTIVFKTSDGTNAPTERVRIDGSGNVGIGTSSPAERLDVQGTGDIKARIYTTGATLGTHAGLYLKTGSYEYIIQNFTTTAGSAGALRFYDITANTERMRITSGGNLLVGKTAEDTTTAGVRFTSGGVGVFTSSADLQIICNRLTNDGTLILFRQDNTDEGSISVSGTTVSYNGGHLSRYAQTTAPKDDTLLKGTVLSNLDEMNEYVDAEGNPVDNEQLNKVKVSDVEGDVNVAGVFVNWSYDKAHNVDEINMAMTGDMIIRIAQSVVVQKGDLLMSAGDGTAKPQGDDIIRSKTIAKVTSNHVTCTYEDGSYCVPCVLMAC